MPRIAIVSDSHVPDREDEIPESFRERVADADRVVHAGDFTSPETLDEFETLADGKLTAVFGNLDPQHLDLPAVTTLDAGGVTFVVAHGTGSHEGWADRVADIAREEGGEDAVGVAGHTHSVTDTDHDGVRLLNPGSVTGADPAEAATMMTADVADGELDVAVHETD
ncbi:metallophosphoesterase family protein [Halobium salinum]|uniref:Phosphoesterase n=1 Tax=Halobium salinum TaxID=1364940 RepID=A0ABD5PBD4_9EURY|nr:YfcE family phosphodiesterase [Halobium salinum]